jgi:hypothetical protein
MTKTNKVEFRWDVSDGFAGGARPHYSHIPDCELLNCDTVECAIQVVEDWISADYAEKVSVSYNLDAIKKKVSDLFRENGRGE